MVILDGVAGLQHDDVLESGNRPQQRLLHVPGQGGRDAIRVDRLIVEPLRLEKDLVSGTVGKADDLVLDRRTIADTRCRYLPGKHRRLVQVLTDQRVGRLVGARDVARHLRVGDPVGQERERPGRHVAVLDHQGLPVDGAAVEPRRRAGLEPTEAETRPFHVPCQGHGSRVADPAGGPSLGAEMDLAPQERAGGQHDGTGPNRLPCGRAHALDPGAGALEPSRLAGSYRQSGLLTEQPLHRGCIAFSIRLCPGALDRRALAAIEGAELDAAPIDRPTHDPIERIDLTHQVAAAEATNGGIARHRPDGLDFLREQQRPRAHPGAGGRRFRAGMATTDDNNVEPFHASLCAPCPGERQASPQAGERAAGRWPTAVLIQPTWERSLPPSSVSPCCSR